MNRSEGETPMTADMTVNPSAHMIYATVSSRDEALKIAKALLEEGLIACANIIDGVTSVYRWEGNTETDTESVVVMKTAADTCEAALERISELHSYDTPCAVSYAMSGGLPDYLAWLISETRSTLKN